MEQNYFKFTHPLLREEENIVDFSDRIYADIKENHPEYNSDSLWAAYEAIFKPVEIAYEKAIWKAIKVGQAISEEDISFIREGELCGWSYGDDEVVEYDIEKSWESVIMILTDTEGNKWGIDGWDSPYESFQVETHIFKKVVPRTKTIYRYAE